jgi:uncharacterized protein (DUF2062 family)
VNKQARLSWRRPVELVRRLLRQGVTPGRLAFSLALGLTVGVAPLLWGTTLICALLAWRLKLNPVAVQAANYACYPLQVALLVPFFIGGQQIFDPSGIPAGELWRQSLDQGPLALGEHFWLASLRALALWALAAPLLLALGQALFFLPLRRWRQASPDPPDRDHMPC